MWSKSVCFPVNSRSYVPKCAEEVSQTMNFQLETEWEWSHMNTCPANWPRYCIVPCLWQPSHQRESSPLASTLSIQPIFPLSTQQPITIQTVIIDYRISPYISREIYPRTKYYTDNSSYTRVTPSGKKLLPEASWIFKVWAHHDSAVVSDNARIDEFSIAPLVYHLHTNPFLCYSWDIILSMHFKCILVNFHVV